jgi:predicted metal-dependent hydrolase
MVKKVLQTPDGISVEVKRTNRKKTVSLSVRDGEARILVPRYITQSRIVDFINSKSDWIRKKCEDHRQRPKRVPKIFDDGEQFLYLGRHYALQVTHGSSVGVKMRRGKLMVWIDVALDDEKRRAQVRTQLVDWYQKCALERFLKRTLYYSEILKVKVDPKKVGIRKYRSRWASCSSEGVLRFNWKVIMAPSRVVDYVVVHELSHLLHFNHSPRFWRCVGAVIPDYQMDQLWLKENAYRMTL